MDGRARLPGHLQSAAMDDVAAIMRLKARYFRCLDTKDWATFAGCFLPEATGAYGGLEFADREALVGFMRKNMGPDLISLHQAHHPEIDVEGDTATGIWYLQDKVIVPNQRFVLEGAAIYADRYRRTDDGWLIEHTGYERTYEMSYSIDNLAGARFKVGPAVHGPQ